MIAIQSIKQFLKPEWRKILIFFFILYPIFLITGILSLDAFIECTEEGFKLHPEKCGRIPAILPIGLKGAVFLSLIFSYIFSCLLISTWDKIKRKKPTV